MSKRACVSGGDDDDDVETPLAKRLRHALADESSSSSDEEKEPQPEPEPLPLLPELWLMIIGDYLSFAEQRTVMTRVCRAFARLLHQAIDQKTMPPFAFRHLFDVPHGWLPTLRRLYPQKCLRSVTFLPWVDQRGPVSSPIWTTGFRDFIVWLHEEHADTLESLEIIEPLADLPTIYLQSIQKCTFPKLSTVCLHVPGQTNYYGTWPKLPSLSALTIRPIGFVFPEPSWHEIMTKFGGQLRELTLDYRRAEIRGVATNLDAVFKMGIKLEKLTVLDFALYGSISIADGLRDLAPRLRELTWLNTHLKTRSLVDIQALLKKTPPGQPFPYPDDENSNSDDDDDDSDSFSRYNSQADDLDFEDWGHSASMLDDDDASD